MKVGDWVVPKPAAWATWIKCMHYADRPLPSPQQVIVVGVDHPVTGCVLLTGATRWWPVEELDPVAGPEAPSFLDLFPDLEDVHAPDH